LASRAYTKKLKLKDSFVNFTLFFIKKKHNCFYLRSQLTPVLHLCVYDESIISVFNILFESILFRFYMFLFPFQNYFTSIASYLISEKKIFLKDRVLEQKKGDLELIRVENTKIWHKNMKPPTRRLGTARASSGTAVPPLQAAFCCFCFSKKLPILVYFWPKVRGFLWNILLMYLLGLK